LAGNGGLAGVALAAAAIPVLSSLVPTNLPFASSPHVDLRVLAFALAATAATGLLFGVAPVVRTWRDHLVEGLTSTARAGGAPRERVRAVLVTTQVVVSVALLVATGLLIKALWRVQQTDPGFRVDGMLTVRTSLPMPKYETEAARARFYAAVLGPVRALPGVAGAAYVGFAPLRGGPNFPVGVDGAAPLDRSLSQVAGFFTVTPGYFATVGIPLLEGRDVSDTDTRDRQFVAVVSESFVRRYWPDRDPIGRTFTFALADRVVVGVVADARVRGLERPSEPQVYVPYRQMRDNVMTWHAPKDLVVRVSGPLAGVPGAIRTIVHRADPQQPLWGLRSFEDLVADQTAARAVQVRVLAAFAGIAFLLAAVGIHGLLSFMVAQRVREIGVRMALGAGAHDIVAMVVGNGVRLGLAGLALGVGVAYASGRGLESTLAGVQPDDPQTFAAAAALIAVMVIVSTFVPTIRALRVNPITAIRSD
ncbi:MAG TPA: FtsX-like permease family protein, partial [Vicinamibacterales bacterium]|nr:FtsX-like permease family protein [Vicinamibacterales bacterium]